MDSFTNKPTVLLFFIALIMVIGFILIFAKIYFMVVKTSQNSGLDGPLGVLPIINPMLSKLVKWNTFNQIDFRLIQDAVNHYKLVVKFDWNNLQNMIQKLAADKQVQILAEQAANAGPTAFDKIVTAMDQTTQPVTVAPNPNTVASLQNIASNTESFFGLQRISTAANTAINNIDVMAISQSEIDDIYRLIDMVRLNLDVQDMISITMDNRIVLMVLPLILVSQTNEYTHLRFDPALALSLMKSNKMQSVTGATKKIEFLIYDQQLVIFPENEETKKLVINL